MRALVFSVAFVFSVSAGTAGAFQDDWRARDLESPIGAKRGEQVQEGAMSFLRDEHGRRIDVNTPYGSTLSTSIGNLISVQAGRGATVVINAQQVNRGNQRAETDLDGKRAEQWLKNVMAVEPAAGPGS